MAGQRASGRGTLQAAAASPSTLSLALALLVRLTGRQAGWQAGWQAGRHTGNETEKGKETAFCSASAQGALLTVVPLCCGGGGGGGGLRTAAGTGGDRGANMAECALLNK